MTSWHEFYNQIKDPSWPECPTEDQFSLLPEHIQSECQDVHGYRVGQFNKVSRLPRRVFPIQTETACQLKWNWSTIYLASETTASCHRTDHHKFDTETFDFHNTPKKLNDRHRMLQGQWPESGCSYCQNIEKAGGVSDRITNLDLVGMHAPPELESDPAATHVTPRILEIYFDNTCNLKCLYCGPYFSSLWNAEIKKHGDFRAGNIKLTSFTKSNNIAVNKEKLFAWLETNRNHLTNFNILGGEPLYQRDLEQCLDVFQRFPAPELKLQIFTNLNAPLSHLEKIVTKIHALIESNHLREFEVTASLDCWGDPQEYVRFPLELSVWQRNFEYLLHQPWINLIVGSTITPLTIKTLPDLLERIQQWRQVRPIYHYQNSVNHPSYMFIDMFGDIFREDFARALSFKPQDTPEEIASYRYLEGIAQQSTSGIPDVSKISDLLIFLNEMDRRRGTDWKITFPWLINEFAKHDLKI